MAAASIATFIFSFEKSSLFYILYCFKDLLQFQSQTRVYTVQPFFEPYSEHFHNLTSFTHIIRISSEISVFGLFLRLALYI